MVGAVGESMGGDGGVVGGVVGWGVLHIVTAFLVGLGGVSTANYSVVTRHELNYAMSHAHWVGHS